jgi:hypothetical protein
MRLKVIVDGDPMPEEEAHAFWKRFSDHMDTHKGDLAGFAKLEGYASVHPKMGPDGAELWVSRTAAQTAYVTAPRSGSGSKKTQAKRKKSR